MTWFEECFFTRLLTACDDYGRMDARPAILKSKLFPLKERLSLKEIQNALDKLADLGCVRLYECDRKPYLYLPAWEVHQRIRNKRSKYPEPETTRDLQTSAETRCQLTAIDSNCCSNPIQSESESNPICAEQAPKAQSSPPSPAPSSENKTGPGEPPAVILLPLNDGTAYAVSSEQCQQWAGLYPAVDVIQQLRNMRGWLDGNPRKRKTRRGILRFVNAWLAREQDRGGSARPPEPPPEAPLSPPEPMKPDGPLLWHDGMDIGDLVD